MGGTLVRQTKEGMETRSGRMVADDDATARDYVLSCDDMMSEVFDQIDCRLTLRRIAQTCKFWKGVATPFCPAVAVLGVTVRPSRLHRASARLEHLGEGMGPHH